MVRDGFQVRHVRNRPCPPVGRGDPADGKAVQDHEVYLCLGIGAWVMQQSPQQIRYRSLRRYRPFSSDVAELARRGDRGAELRHAPRELLATTVARYDHSFARGGLAGRPLSAYGTGSLRRAAAGRDCRLSTTRDRIGRKRCVWTIRWISMNVQASTRPSCPTPTGSAPARSCRRRCARCRSPDRARCCARETSHAGPLDSSRRERHVGARRRTRPTGTCPRRQVARFPPRSARCSAAGDDGGARGGRNGRLREHRSGGAAGRPRTPWRPLS